jgi:hypothetical protein
MLGRFIGRDPLGYVDGTCLYMAYYVPIGLDPFGEEACQCDQRPPLNCAESGPPSIFAGSFPVGPKKILELRTQMTLEISDCGDHPCFETVTEVWMCGRVYNYRNFKPGDAALEETRRRFAALFGDAIMYGANRRLVIPAGLKGFGGIALADLVWTNQVTNVNAPVFLLNDMASCTKTCKCNKEKSSSSVDSASGKKSAE